MHNIRRRLYYRSVELPLRTLGILLCDNFYTCSMYILGILTPSDLALAARHIEAHVEDITTLIRRDIVDPVVAACRVKD